jgi:hypothetical protein
MPAAMLMLLRLKGISPIDPHLSADLAGSDADLAYGLGSAVPVASPGGPPAAIRIKPAAPAPEKKGKSTGRRGGSTAPNRPPKLERRPRWW